MLGATPSSAARALYPVDGNGRMGGRLGGFPSGSRGGFGGFPGSFGGFPGGFGVGIGGTKDQIADKSYFVTPTSIPETGETDVVVPTTIPETDNVKKHGEGILNKGHKAKLFLRLIMLRSTEKEFSTKVTKPRLTVMHMTTTKVTKERLQLKVVLFLTLLNPSYILEVAGLMKAVMEVFQAVMMVIMAVFQVVIVVITVVFQAVTGVLVVALVV